MALTASRETDERKLELDSFPVAATYIIYAGALVMLNSSGYARPGATATGMIAVGKATQYVDNTDGAAGDENVEVALGCFSFKNSSSTDEIATDDYGKLCYIVDDQTVALTDGSTAGTAQVTRGDVVFNGTDQVGLDVDALPTLAVASDTDDDTTATALRDAWNASAQHAAAATASVDLSGAESYIILSFLDGGAAAHTVTAYSPATADITGITNTTARVAPVAATRSAAGRIRGMNGSEVWVELGAPAMAGR